MILHDFYCSFCAQSFETLVNRDDTVAPCPECDGDAEKTVSAPHVKTINSPSRRADSLKKRSEDHSLREAKRNPESYASKMGAKPKAQAKWNIRSTKK